MSILRYIEIPCTFKTRASIHGCMSTETTTPIIYHRPTPILYHLTHLPHPIPPTHLYPKTTTHPHPIPPTLYYPLTPPPLYHPPTYPHPIPPTYPYPIEPTYPHLPLLYLGYGLVGGSKNWCKANISPKLNYRHLVHSRQ